MVDTQNILSFIENNLIGESTNLKSVFIHVPSFDFIDLEIIFKVSMGLTYDDRVVLHEKISKSLEEYFKKENLDVSFLIILQDVH